MKSTKTEFPVLAFVDIETTGGNSERDRITEIGFHCLTRLEKRRRLIRLSTKFDGLDRSGKVNCDECFDLISKQII